MSCGAGWMANYIRGRNRLDEVINTWRERTFRKTTVDRRDMCAGAVLAQVDSELAELRLTVAVMLRMLRAANIISEVNSHPCQEDDAMSTTTNIFNKYLDNPAGPRLARTAGRRRGEDFQVAPDDSAPLLEELGEMRLVVASMLRMLVEGGTLTREHLEKMADETDALDGSADGRLTARLGPDRTMAVNARPTRRAQRTGQGCAGSTSEVLHASLAQKKRPVSVRYEPSRFEIGAEGSHTEPGPR